MTGLLVSKELISLLYNLPSNVLESEVCATGRIIGKSSISSASLPVFCHPVCTQYRELAFQHIRHISRAMFSMLTLLDLPHVST